MSSKQSHFRHLRATGLDELVPDDDDTVLIFETTEQNSEEVPVRVLLVDWLWHQWELECVRVGHNVGHSDGVLMKMMNAPISTILS